MRILIVGFYTPSYMPYVQKYEEILRENGVAYDLTCFDRESEGPLLQEGNRYVFRCRLGTDKRKKLVPYLRYFRFVKNLIRQNRYDGLIVLTTLPAVFLGGVLRRKYRNRYIFDYRDTTYEHLPAFKKRVDRLVSRSFATFVSSEGFLNVLKPAPNIGIVHNISNESHMISRADPLPKTELNIGFAGYVRYFDVHSRLIEAFANRPRYKLTYAGYMYDDCDLKSFAERVGARNVAFAGTFDNADKPRIYKEVSVINSVYSTALPEVRWAIPNRFYDALLFKKPILVAKGTYLAELTEKYGVGLAVNPFEDDVPALLDAFAETFDSEKFTENCEKLLEKIKADEERFKQKVTAFVTERAFHEADSGGVRHTPRGR